MTEQTLSEVKTEPVVESSTPTDTTVASDSVNTPESLADKAETTEQPAKSFSQEEVDALISKRLAREQRKWQRDNPRSVQPEPLNSGQPLQPSQFKNDEDFTQAVINQRAEELVREREATRQRETALHSYREREEVAREKFDDFEQVAYNPALPITTDTAEVIQASDIGPDILYWLGSNVKEAQRISQLSPLQQAREIGKIEATLVAKPVEAKRISKAPDPIKPITTKSVTAVRDTTDPRSTNDMSVDEWIAAERLRVEKKFRQ